MVTRVPRLILALAGLVQLACSAIHAAAFSRADAAFAGSNLRPLFANSARALWLGDSTTLAVVAVLCGLIAMWPSAASRAVVIFLAFIPALTALLIYIFLGVFFAAHLLLISAVAMFFAGLKFPGIPMKVG